MFVKISCAISRRVRRLIWRGFDRSNVLWKTASPLEMQGWRGFQRCEYKTRSRIIFDEGA
jgi:hypothetical protein